MVDSLTRHYEFADSPENPTAFNLFWYGEKIGSFTFGGRKEWHPEPGYESMFVMDEMGKLPCFLDNINPDGWLKSALEVELQTEYVAKGLRFLSNFVIVREGERTDNIVVDELHCSLTQYTNSEGVFTGAYEAHQGLAGEDEHDEALKSNWKDRHMPRLSGAEQKLFMTLYPCGTMQPAQRTCFTHFAKYPGVGGYESLGLNEFLGMKMAKAAGLSVPPFALVDQGEHPPLFCVERFDIPREHDPQAQHKILMQDFCTLMQKEETQKFAGSMEAVFKKVKELSDQYSPALTQANTQALFDRVAVSWLMNDGDLHLKNISMIFKVDPQTNAIQSAEFAPTYDATIDLFSEQGGTSSAVLMGSTTRPNRKLKDFVVLARNVGLFKDENGAFDQNAAESHLQNMATKMAKTAVDFAENPPHLKAMSPILRQDIRFMASHVVDRARVFGAETPEWDSKAEWNRFKEHSPKRRKMVADGRFVERAGKTRKVSACRARGRQ